MVTPDVGEPDSSTEVTAGALCSDGRVLLCHRRADRVSYPNVWDLPGGHVEPGESALDALLREMWEELRIEPLARDEKPWKYVTVGDLRLHLYLITEWGGHPRNAAKQEHDRIKWFRLDELPSLTLAHPTYADLLAEALRESASPRNQTP